MARFVLEGRPFLARDDVMLVSNGTTTTVSLSVLGEPVAQPRMRCRCFFARVRRAIVYDPAQQQKVAFKREVSQALAAVGATPFPLFGNNIKIKVKATFHIFSRLKDIDNLVKFLLDSLQGVIYKNDNMVYELVTKKVRTTRNLEYTELEIENLVG